VEPLTRVVVKKVYSPDFDLDLNAEAEESRFPALAVGLLFLILCGIFLVIFGVAASACSNGGSCNGSAEVTSMRSVFCSLAARCFCSRP
jgi:hypothetical protein